MNRNQAKHAGWMVVASSWLASFCLFGYRATFAVLKVPIAREMHWSAASITTGYSLLMTVYAVMAFCSGVIIDRWGTRPCYLMAAIFGSLGFLVTAQTSGLHGYYAAFGVLGGIGTGMLWVTSTISVRKWYVGKEYAKMVGLAFMGGPMAQVVLGLLVKAIIPVYGWRVAAQILAVIVLVCMLLAASLTRRSPEYYGVKPFGSAADEEDCDESTWSLHQAFRTYPIWAAILTFLCSLVGEHLIWSQMVSYLVDDLGMSLGKAVYLYSTIGVFGIFSMPIMGIVSDKIVHASTHEASGRKIALMIGPLVGAMACITLLRANTSVGFAVFACFLFAVYWAMIPGAVVGYSGALYGRKSLGKIWGMATLLCMGIGPASGSYMGGFIRDHSGSYRASILFASGAFLVSSLFALTLPMATRQSHLQTESVPVRKAA